MERTKKFLGIFLPVLIGVMSVAGIWFGDTVYPVVTVMASGIQAFATVPAGGTGRTTLTAHAVLLGAGTAQVNFAPVVGTGNCLLDNGVSSDPTFQSCPGGSTALHVITFAINGGGSTVATGDVLSYPTADYACTITRVDVSGAPSGSITVDIWKAAGAIPTSANKISASAPASLTAAQLHQSGSLTGWTTSVSIGDVFGASVQSVTSVTNATVQIWCQ